MRKAAAVAATARDDMSNPPAEQWWSCEIANFGELLALRLLFSILKDGT
jgi:hypothetical protein